MFWHTDRRDPNGGHVNGVQGDDVRQWRSNHAATNTLRSTTGICADRHLCTLAFAVTDRVMAGHVAAGKGSGGLLCGWRMRMDRRERGIRHKDERKQAAQDEGGKTLHVSRF